MCKKYLLEIPSIIISVIAITISFRSCYIANESLNLSKQQYIDKFKTILKFTYLKDKEVFKVEPANQNVILQKANVYYPTEISKHKWQVRLPDNYLYMTSIIFSLKEFVKKRISPKKGYVQVLDNARIPVIVELYYTYNGDNFYDIHVRI